MTCPHCQTDIDDDSLFCDQCGAQILVCSVCGRPGKDSHCIFDGKPLVKAGAAQDTPKAQAPSPISAQATAPVQGTKPVPAPTSSSSAGPLLRLVGKSAPLRLEPASGDVIGRTTGPFASTLGTFSYVSGKHLRVDQTATGWTATDQNSTNGTFWNGQRLAPHTAQALSAGGVLTLADLEFVIEIETVGNGPKRGAP